MTAQPAPASTSNRLLGGMIIAVIGAIVIGGQLIDGFERYTLLTAALVCLLGFLVSRDYAVAIAAGFMGGIGTAVVIAPLLPSDSVGPGFLFATAVGLLAIWILGLFARPIERNPWPLIPAAIVGLVGTSAALHATGSVDWPGILLGIFLLGIGGVVALRR